MQDQPYTNNAPFSKAWNWTKFTEYKSQSIFTTAKSSPNKHKHVDFCRIHFQGNRAMISPQIHSSNSSTGFQWSGASDSNSSHLPTKHFTLVVRHTWLTSYSTIKLLSPHAYPPLSRFLFHSIIYHLALELLEFLHLKSGIFYLFKSDNQSHFPHSNAI